MSRPQALASVQAARAAAVMLVLLYHTGGTIAAPKYFGTDPTAGLFAFGYAGVDLFFVISGFIICHVHATDVGRPGQLAGFVRKRVRRIFPAYWVVLGILSAVLLVQGRFWDFMPRDAWVVAKTIALLPQDPAVVPGTGAPIVTPAWSLWYELLFYACFAAFIASRAAGFALVTGLAAWAALADGYVARFVGSPLVLEFAMGVLAWHAARHEPRAALAKAAIFAGIAGFATTACFDLALGGFEASVWRLAYAAASALALFGVVARERTRPLRVPRAISFLGDASYAIYLVHYAALSVASQGLARAASAVALAPATAYVIASVCALAAGVAFHFAVERPLMRVGRDRSQRPRLA